MTRMRQAIQIAFCTLRTGISFPNWNGVTGNAVNSMRKSCKKPPDRTKSVKGGGNMKLSAIALKNLKRNFSFYSLYLFSVSFVLMIYFCFTSFSMNQIIMEKISSDGRVETMCRTVAVFIMAFVIFYMFYSNSFFMRRRMRELGIY